MGKTYRIFGYASLMNEDSLKKTVSSATNIFPAKLYGFIRVFNVKEDRQMTLESDPEPRASLNVEMSEWNEYINGVCFDMSEEEFSALQEREHQYELVRVQVQPYENENSLLKAYVWRAAHYETYDFQENSKAQLEYLEVCLDGAKSWGDDFLEHFKETTFIGDKTLKELGY